MAKKSRFFELVHVYTAINKKYMSEWSAFCFNIIHISPGHRYKWLWHVYASLKEDSTPGTARRLFATTCSDSHKSVFLQLFDHCGQYCYILYIMY